MRNHVSILAALTMACAAFAAPAFALGNEGSFEVGSKFFNVGVGPSGSSALYGSAPFWFITGEVGVSENLSVGGFAGYTGRTGQLDGYDSSFNLGYSMYGARASYHLTDFFDDERLDLYGGASIGRQSLKVTVANSIVDVTAANGMGWVYGVHAGGRYFFTPKVAGFVEGCAFQSQTPAGVNQDVTYGPGNVSAGLTLKF